MTKTFLSGGPLDTSESAHVSSPVFLYVFCTLYFVTSCTKPTIQRYHPKITVHLKLRYSEQCQRLLCTYSATVSLYKSREEDLDSSGFFILGIQSFSLFFFFSSFSLQKSLSPPGNRKSEIKRHLVLRLIFP